MPKIQDEALTRAINDILTCLTEGAHWHEAAAEQCYNLPVRGWSEWHKIEAMNDKKVLEALTEIVRSGLEMSPNIDTRKIDRAKRLKLRNVDDFEQHHFDWLDREERLAEAVNFAAKKSESIDQRLHQILSSIKKEVSDEIKLVQYAHDSLDFTDYMPHDVSVKSMAMQYYFKRDYKPNQPIYFMIG